MDLFVTSEGRSQSTVVDNRFIDKYMLDANDAQLKVYLYLLRMMSAGLSTDVSKMADLFNHTERDIIRSLEYWEKKGLLSLEYDSNNSLYGIKFCNPGKNVSESGSVINAAGSTSVLSQAVPANSVKAATPVELMPETAEIPVEKKAKFDASISYTSDQLKHFKNDDDTAQIVFVAEQYLKRTLSMSDLQSLYFIYDELKFSCEMTDYLLQYCLDRGKSSFSYIKAVAIRWAEDGITTPKQARELATTKYESYVYSVLKSLGKTASPSEPEANMVIKWYKEMGMELEVIDEACRRTVMATDSHRLEYCDKILSSWKAEGVHHVADIEKADSNFKKTRARNVKSSAPSGTFQQFTKTDYDFDALEKILSNQ